MIQITRILVPIDFSEASKKALVYGFILAARFKAKLVAAHIVPESSALAYAFPVEAAFIEQEQFAEATKQLKTLLSQGPGSAMETEAITKIGHIDNELISIVRNHSIDLVVMGTHGRRHPVRWFMGSVTERMLRKVPVPVVTVSRIDDGRHLVNPRLAGFHHILYAADSPEPGPALDYAMEFAGRFGAKLTVLHVVEPLDSLHAAGAILSSVVADRVNEMHRRFEEFLSRVNLRGLQIETMIRTGKAYSEIVNIAEDLSMDLIVLNMHRKGVVERASLGSTAERVVRISGVPVLSIPAHGAPETHQAAG
jgi:nucleotide-binding universal stress UspA family protein